MEILKKYLVIKDCGLFLDLVAYYIVAENNVTQYYPDYVYNHPLLQWKCIYIDSKVSNFFAYSDHKAAAEWEQIDARHEIFERRGIGMYVRRIL